MAHIICARLADVEVEGKLARELQLHPGIPTPQLVLKQMRLLMQHGNQRLHRRPGRLQSHQHKSPAAFSKKNSIAQLKIRDHPGHPGVLSQLLHNRRQRLLAFRRIGWRKPLNYKNHALNEG